MIETGKRNQSILVVDQEEDTRLSICELIKINLGPEIRLLEAEDGASGLSKICNQAFDCIVTELNLPKKNGLPLISAIRSSNFNEITPVIIVSNHPGRNDIAAQFSFIDSLKKPFDFQKLLDLLFKYVGNTNNPNRVSANLYNKMIRVTQTLITEISREDTEVIGTPFFKNKGTGLDQDLILEIGVESGKLKNNFAIAFDSKDLIEFQQKNNFHTDKSAKVLVNAFAQVIFNNIGGGKGQGTYSKLKISRFNLKEDGLKDKKGLVIKIENSSFKIGVFASAR